MSSPHSQAPLNGGYDQSLLAAAPEVSKAAKQEGYNVDLLDERRHGTSAQHHMNSIDPEAGRSNEKVYGSPVARGPAAPIPPRTVSFWRTPRAIIGIVIVAVIIVGAVVGGAVGGSVGKKKHNVQAVQGQAPGLNSTSSGNNTGGQGVQPVAPGSPSAPSSSSSPHGGIAIALPTGAVDR